MLEGSRHVAICQIKTACNNASDAKEVKVEISLPEYVASCAVVGGKIKVLGMILL